MEQGDRVLKCADCGSEFVFTAGERAFHADKGFRNEPKRCKACKAPPQSNSRQFGVFPRGDHHQLLAVWGGRPPCPLSRPRGGPSIVENAFSNVGLLLARRLELIIAIRKLIGCLARGGALFCARSMFDRDEPSARSIPFYTANHLRKRQNLIGPLFLSNVGRIAECLQGTSGA